MGLRPKLSATHVLYSGLGGHTAVAFALVDEFRRRGYDSSCLFFGVEKLLESSHDWCVEQRVPYRFVQRGPSHLEAQANLGKALWDLRPDAVICHSASAIIPTAIYCALRRVPLIFRATQSNHLKTRTERILTELSLLTSSRNVFLTPEYAAEICDGRWRDWVRKKSAVIPNGLDLSYFRPRAEERQARPGQPIRVGMASRLVSIKDIPTLIQAFGLLLTRYKQEAVLEIAGEGPELEKLRNLTQVLNLTEHVRFVGLLTGGALLAFFQELDIYVHATYGETMSNSLMQALAVGKPVVASDVPGVSNMLSSGQDSLLVPLLDADEMARALSLLCNSPSYRAELGSNGRRKAERHYSRESQANAYLRVIGWPNR